jgi:hypothetical protein
MTTRVDPRDLAELLGVDLANPGASNGDTGRRSARAEHAGAPVNLDRYPSVRKALERRTKDRSADTYRVVAMCHRVGLTLAETTWVVRSRDDLKERLDERSDDDLLAIWLKLDDDARTGSRTEPPSAPVTDGAELLDAVHAALTKFVIFPSKAAAVGATLWTAATHGLPAWQHATRLVLRSPQKRCGKSRLLDVAERLCFNPLMSTNASVAAIYRCLGDDYFQSLTLLIDEGDALFGTRTKAEQNEDLRSLIDAGWQRGRTVLRCVGPNQEPTEFDTFSMCALAAIKGLPDTITDRAVVIGLKRRSRDETVARFRIRRDTAPLLELRARLTAWVREGERLTRLGDAEPAMPDGIEDRAQDAWEPLIAIADEAGGHWPETARTACAELCAQVDGVDDDDIRLLTDIEGVFAGLTRTLQKYSPNAEVEFLQSVQLVRELKERDESPWRDADLTAHKLARMLRPFDVKPRYGGSNGSQRGYWQADFADAFSRYGNCGNCGTAG